MEESPAFVLKRYGRIKNKPAKPIHKVISNCAVAHITVNATDDNLELDFTNKILPKYSPKRLGVKNAIVVPLNIACNDLANETFSTSRSDNCHFFASSPQFTNINRNANNR